VIVLGLLVGGLILYLVDIIPYFYHLPPLHNMPYIIVYGREGEQETEALISGLRKEHLRYFFKDVARADAMNEMRDRLTTVGIDAYSYNLPVVDVNAKIFARPGLNRVKRWYGWAKEEWSRNLARRVAHDPEQALVVSGIVMGSVPVVIIDGKMLKVGDIVRGYRIFEIHPGYVRLHDPAGRGIERRLETAEKKR
jgi:hypothetical protein